MSRVDIRDLVGGMCLTVTGGVFAGYAALHYSIGTVTRMGPGMVPLFLGLLLSLFGLVVVVSAFSRHTEEGEVRILVPGLILLSVLVFALLVNTLGLIPAIIGCVLVSCLAELEFRPLFSLMLAIVLSALAWLIFVATLQLPVSLFDWPF